MGVGRRHHLVLVLRVDAHDEFALGGLAREKRFFGERRLAHVEAKLTLAVGGVGAVASEAVVGQQRPHIAVELDLRRDPHLRSERWPKGQQGKQQDNGPTAHQRGHSAGKCATLPRRGNPSFLRGVLARRVLARRPPSERIPPTLERPTADDLYRKAFDGAGSDGADAPARATREGRRKRPLSASGRDEKFAAAHPPPRSTAPIV